MKPGGVRSMTVDQLFAVGNRQREQNYECGVSQSGVDWLTETWIEALVDFQDLPVEVARALARRWCVRVQR